MLIIRNFPKSIAGRTKRPRGPQVVRCILCWRGETGGYAQVLALIHQRFQPLWRDALSKICAYATEWDFAKVLPIGPHTC